MHLKPFPWGGFKSCPLGGMIGGNQFFFKVLGPPRAPRVSFAQNFLRPKRGRSSFPASRTDIFLPRGMGSGILGPTSSLPQKPSTSLRGPNTRSNFGGWMGGIKGEKIKKGVCIFFQFAPLDLRFLKKRGKKIKEKKHKNFFLNILGI